MSIVRDGNDYEPQQISRHRLRELMQIEKVFTELLTAAKSVVEQFEFIKRVQHKELVEGQTLESAAANWEGLGNEYIEFQPLIDAITKAEGRAGSQPT